MQNVKSESIKRYTSIRQVRLKTRETSYGLLLKDQINKQVSVLSPKFAIT